MGGKNEQKENNMKFDARGSLCETSTVDALAGEGPAQMTPSPEDGFVIGIDPGITGALAILDKWGALRSVHDLPTATVIVAGKPRTRVCPYGLDDLILRLSAKPLLVFMEELTGAPSRPPGAAMGRPGAHQMGGGAAFSLGRSYGLLEGVLAAHRLPLALVRPQVWQKRVGLGGAGMAKDQRKSLSRQTATRLWPGFAKSFSRVKDDGRSDAALIAHYGFLTTVKQGI